MNFRCAFFLLLGLLPCYAMAQEVAQEKIPNWYEVEVVVLTAQAPVADDEEGFAGDPGTPQAERIVYLVDDDRSISASLSLGSLPTPYSKIAPLEQKLAETINRLERGRNFKPLLHWGWRQPGLDREESSAVRIDSDAAALELELALGRAEQAETVQEAPPSASAEQTDDTGNKTPGVVTRLLAAPRAVAGELPRVSGLVTMSANRFLHVELDLLLAIADPYWAGGADELRPTRSYRMQQRRRVRRDEVHYFDHPRFGVLVQVRGIDSKPE